MNERKEWRENLIETMLKSGGYQYNIVEIAEQIERYVFRDERTVGHGNCCESSYQDAT